MQVQLSKFCLAHFQSGNTGTLYLLTEKNLSTLSILHFNANLQSDLAVSLPVNHYIPEFPILREDLFL